MLIVVGAAVGAAIDPAWASRGAPIPEAILSVAGAIADLMAPLRHLAFIHSDPPEPDWTRSHQAVLGAALPVAWIARAAWRRRVWLAEALRSELAVFSAVRQAERAAPVTESEAQSLARRWLAARSPDAEQAVPQRPRPAPSRTRRADARAARARIAEVDAAAADWLRALSRGPERS